LNEGHRDVQQGQDLTLHQVGRTFILDSRVFDVFSLQQQPPRAQAF